MKLFGKKKSEKFEEKSNLEDLPDLPEFPGAKEESLNFPKFPDYNQDTKFQPPQQQKIDNFPHLEPLNLNKEIPARKKPEMNFKPVKFKPMQMPQEEFRIPEEQEFERPHLSSSKPIYIQLEKFKEAASSIDKIKEKIHQADEIIEEISRLRAEEDKELELWHADLNNIKERLLRIDKALFGDA